jgi:branched-chain amino acid transport system substrate-binding protein
MACASTTIATAATKQPVVTIGVIAPIDGGLTSFGQGIRNSVQLAVDEANEQGTIPGWTIKVRALDDSSDPATGEAAARKLAADKSVVAVVGPYNSGVAEKAAPILARRGIPLVSPSNTLTSLTLGADAESPKRPWKTYFRLAGPDSLQAQFLAQQARDLGFATAAVVSETKAVSKGLADNFASAFAARGGTVTVQQVVPDGATTFTDFLDAAAPTNPGLLFFGGEYQVAASLRTAATAAGIVVPLMGGDGMKDPAYITDAGEAAAGSYASTVGVPIASIPGADEFLAAYEESGFADDPTDFGLYAYDAAKTVIASLRSPLRGEETLPSKTRTVVVRGIQKADRTGVTGPIAFDTYGDIKSPAFTLYTVAGSPLAWTPVG